MTAKVNTVLVVGATGQTGRVVVATALEHRPPGPSPGARRATEPVSSCSGADVVGGDLTDAATLDHSGRGGRRGDLHPRSDRRLSLLASATRGAIRGAKWSHLGWP